MAYGDERLFERENRRLNLSSSEDNVRLSTDFEDEYYFNITSEKMSEVEFDLSACEVIYDTTNELRLKGTIAWKKTDIPFNIFSLTRKQEQKNGSYIKTFNISDMNNIKIVRGNIFNTKAQTVVNTVNCVGVMGKGIALVYKLRYPQMFDIYHDYCKRHLISIGKLWLYKGDGTDPWVLNFPTKFHWKYPSKIEYIEQGLKNLLTHTINVVLHPLHSQCWEHTTVDSIKMQFEHL